MNKVVAAMARTIPIYADHDEVYRADSCRPLVEAAGTTVYLKALKHGHYPGLALPAGALAGIKMVGFWDAKTDQAWGLPQHRNEGIELSFLEAGRLAFRIDGNDYELRPGTLTVARPWQAHCLGKPNVTASRLHWLILDLGVRRPHQEWIWPSWLVLSPTELNELTRNLRENEQPVWEVATEVRHCFESISRFIESYRGGPGMSRLVLHVNELFVLLLEMFRQKEIHRDQSLTSRQRTVQLFLDDLRSNPEHLSLEWSLEKMANSCGLGVTQFTNYTRILVNMTPGQYLIHCRVELAAKLLRTNPTEPITDVALNCGFSSSQYFATVFSHQFNLSPRVYRKKYCS